MKINKVVVILLFSLTCLTSVSANYKEKILQRKGTIPNHVQWSEVFCENQVLKPSMLGSPLSSILFTFGFGYRDFEIDTFSYNISFISNRLSEGKSARIDGFLFISRDGKIELLLYIDPKLELSRDDFETYGADVLDCACIGIEFVDTENHIYEVLGRINSVILATDSKNTLIFGELAPSWAFPQKETGDCPRSSLVETLRERFEQNGSCLTVGEVLDTLGPGNWEVRPQSSISMNQLDPLVFGFTFCEDDSNARYFVYLDEKELILESEFSKLMKEDWYRELIVVGGEYFDPSNNNFEYWGKAAVKILEDGSAVGWLNQFAPSEGIGTR